MHEKPRTFYANTKTNTKQHQIENAQTLTHKRTNKKMRAKITNKNERTLTYKHTNQNIQNGTTKKNTQTRVYKHTNKNL